MTVHSAKAGVRRGVPDRHGTKRWFPVPRHRQREERRAREERRLADVAITRARRRLTITYAGTARCRPDPLPRPQPVLTTARKDAIKLKAGARRAFDGRLRRQPLRRRYVAATRDGGLPQSRSGFEGQRYTAADWQRRGAVGAGRACSSSATIQPRSQRRQRSCSHWLPARTFRRGILAVFVALDDTRARRQRPPRLCQFAAVVALALEATAAIAVTAARVAADVAGRRNGAGVAARRTRGARRAFELMASSGRSSGNWLRFEVTVGEQRAAACISDVSGAARA